MNYPVKQVMITNGCKLFVPDEACIQSTYQSLLANDPDTPFPFWARIWPSAFALSDFLKTEPGWITGKRVLEIGAGIGLPSFTMAAYASEMVISDHSAEAVALMEKNIQCLGLTHLTAKCLDWNHFPEDCKADVVLLSDINYDPEQFGSLLQTINHFLEQGSTLILSTPNRITLKPFATALEPFIKSSVLRTVEQKDSSTDILVWILSL